MRTFAFISCGHPLKTICALVAVASACAPSHPLSQAPPQSRVDTIPIQIEEGTRLSFDLSSDGETLAFDALGQIWLFPAQGGESRPLTDAQRDTAELTDPVFSPDGRYIVFRGERSGRTGLWQIPTEGGEIRQLTDSATDAGVSWSPDGRRFVFARLSRRRDADSVISSPALHVMDAETGLVHALPIEGLPRRGVRDPVWSPDGSRIAFVNAPLTSRPFTRLPPAGRIWEVDAEGGLAVPLLEQSIDAVGPAYSPNGRQVAFFAPDSVGRVQLWIVERKTGASPHRLTDHFDTTPLRVRWSADGNDLLYSADGKLWRLSIHGGDPREIPFSAVLTLHRRRPPLPPVRFPAPGIAHPARGHMGMALSPDGAQIGMIALGQLWVIPLNGEPRSIAKMPQDAAGLTWSPDGSEVAWSGGLFGAEDLYATDLGTGMTRRITALPGGESRPLWSPDGRHIAFVHITLGGAPHLRVVPALAQSLSDTASIPNLGTVSDWFNAETPEWSPDSRSLLVYENPSAALLPTLATVVSLDGTRRPVEGFPDAPTFVRWLPDGSLVYINQFMVWRATIADEQIGEPVILSDRPALYLSASRDGALLYYSGDGLRFRGSDRTERHLGWPLTYQVAEPDPLLIRNVRVIDGTGAPPTNAQDILLQAGRIVAIAEGGSLPSPPSGQVVDGDGRIAMPGLIDLHGHLQSDPTQLNGLLYHGVTTVRDMGTPIAKLAGFRDAAAAGRIPGPRISFGGFQLWEAEPGSYEDGHGPVDDAGISRTLALLQGFGADHVKMRSMRAWNVGARIIAGAHALGMRVTGHCTHPLPLLAAGIDSNEHFFECNQRPGRIPHDDMVQLHASAALPVVSTISWLSSVLALKGDTTLWRQEDVAPFASPAIPARYTWAPTVPDSWGESAELGRRGARMLHEGGVRLGASADGFPIPWATHLELEELVRAGLTPLEAIRAATGDAAKIMGAEEEIGTIELGRWGDILILDGDPTQNIGTTRLIWQVIQGGVAVDRSALRSGTR